MNIFYGKERNECRDCRTFADDEFETCTIVTQMPARCQEPIGILLSTEAMSVGMAARSRCPAINSHKKSLPPFFNLCHIFCPFMKGFFDRNVISRLSYSPPNGKQGSVGKASLFAFNESRGSSAAIINVASQSVNGGWDFSRKDNAWSLQVVEYV